MKTNFDLINICKNNGIPLNCVVMKDQLLSVRKKKNMNIIINLQSSTKGNGTHWVALIIRNKNAFYFDSYGAIPPVEIIKFCGGAVRGGERMDDPVHAKQRIGNNALGYNAYIVQDLNSVECGLFCIALMHYLLLHGNDIYVDANDFINMFENDTKLNDDILFDYLLDFQG